MKTGTTFTIYVSEVLLHTRFLIWILCYSLGNES